MSRPLKNPARPRRAASGSTERREQVREGACRTFAKLGVSSATMRDVAEEVGILAGSIYHHFQSKDELLAEILKDFYDDVMRDLQTVVDQHADPLKALSELFRTAFRYVVERRDEATIVFNDYAYLSRLPAFEFVVKSANEVERFWVDVLQRGMDANKIRSDLDPAMAYRTIMGAIYSSVRWYNPKGPMDPETLLQQQATLFLDGVRQRRSRR